MLLRFFFGWEARQRRGGRSQARWWPQQHQRESQNNAAHPVSIERMPDIGHMRVRRAAAPEQSAQVSPQILAVMRVNTLSRVHVRPAAKSSGLGFPH
jgi:hypothetical protein